MAGGQIDDVGHGCCNEDERNGVEFRKGNEYEAEEEENEFCLLLDEDVHQHRNPQGW